MTLFDDLYVTETHDDFDGGKKYFHKSQPLLPFDVCPAQVGAPCCAAGRRDSLSPRCARAARCAARSSATRVAFARVSPCRASVCTKCPRIAFSFMWRGQSSMATQVDG